MHSKVNEQQRGSKVIKPLALILVFSLAGLVGLGGYVSFQATSVPVLAGDLTAVPADGTPGSGVRVITNSNEAAVCSLGTPWVSSDGVKGWLTAAHCFSEVGQEVYSNDGRVVGVGELAGLFVDSSFVRAIRPKQVKAQLDINNVTTPIVDAGKAEVGDQLCVIGFMSGLSCGWEVTSSLERVEVEDGKEVEGAVATGRGESCARQGDSGGMVFKFNGKEAVSMGTVVAVRDTPEMTTLIPATCTVIFATNEQSAKVLGGGPYLGNGK